MYESTYSFMENQSTYIFMKNQSTYIFMEDINFNGAHTFLWGWSIHKVCFHREIITQYFS